MWGAPLRITTKRFEIDRIHHWQNSLPHVYAFVLLFPTGADRTAGQPLCANGGESHLRGLGLRVQRSCPGLRSAGREGVQVQERATGGQRLQLQILRSLPGGLAYAVGITFFFFLWGVEETSSFFLFTLIFSCFRFP